MSDDEFCQNCRFWDPKWKFKKEQRFEREPSATDLANPRMTTGLRKQSGKGLCRRYAPQASALTTAWTETESSDWCGDFQKMSGEAATH